MKCFLHINSVAKPIFFQVYNWFKFRVFLLLDQLPYQGRRAQLPYYLSIAWGRIVEFIPFSRVLALCDMQVAASRIWTRIIESTALDNTRYTTSASKQASPFGNVKLDSCTLVIPYRSTLCVVPSVNYNFPIKARKPCIFIHSWEKEMDSCLS